jgi:hypothetical protein
VNTIEELLGRKSSGSGLENRDYGSRDPAACVTSPSTVAFTIYFIAETERDTEPLCERVSVVQVEPGLSVSGVSCSAHGD